MNETDAALVHRDLMGFQLEWTFHFHSTLIDDQQSLLDLTSDLSLFCWYQDLFKRLFQEFFHEVLEKQFSKVIINFIKRDATESNDWKADGDFESGKLIILKKKFKILI